MKLTNYLINILGRRKIMFNKKKLEKNTIYGETKKDENVSEVSEEKKEKLE